jgi:DNA-binding transcriptional regulator YiaG
MTVTYITIVSPVDRRLGAVRGEPTRTPHHPRIAVMVHQIYLVIKCTEIPPIDAIRALTWSKSNCSTILKWGSSMVCHSEGKLTRDMNSQQCRAARALLKWSQTKLAESSGVALSTVAEFEIDKREPREDNVTAIRRALEDAGVEFIPARGGKGVGVRLREDQEK